MDQQQSTPSTTDDCDPYAGPINPSGRLETHPYGYDVDTYARLLYGVVEHLNLPKIHLLGHSHGGFVAQNIALAHPDRLAALILDDSGRGRDGAVCRSYT